MIGSVKKFVHMSSNSLGDGESDGQLGNFKKKKKQPREVEYMEFLEVGLLKK